MSPARRTIPLFVAGCLACGTSPGPAPAAKNAPAADPAAGPESGDASPPPAAPADAAAPPAAADAGPPIPFPIPDWPTGTPEEQGLTTAGLEAAATVAEANQSHCLLVIRHGVLVFERYWNGRDVHSKDPSWSIAKSYSSALVGIAIDRGDIQSLDQSAADFVPEWKGTDRAAITIRDLVSMASGLKWDVFEDYVTLATLASDDTTFAIDRPLASTPGTTWTYDNGTVQVLERVFRAATGGTIEDYARAHLWSRIGSDASWKHDPSGNPTTYANVLASCRDHARLGYLYLHGGSWAGAQVISRGWVTASVSPSQSINRAYG